MHFFKVDAKNKQGYKWVCMADGPPDPVSGKRRQISRRADTQKEAKQRVEKVINDISDRGIDERKLKSITFDQIAAEWLETYSKSEVKNSTIKSRVLEIKILNRYIAKINIHKVTSYTYQKMLNSLDDEDYARSTISGIHTTASMIFKYSIKEKLRIDNPTADAVIPMKKLTVDEIENLQIEDHYLEKDEIREFLEVVRTHGLDNDLERFYLLAFTGMRSGELCALKWPDINFTSNEIRITKTLYSPFGNMKKYELTPPKTKASIRTFDIDESVINLLVSLKKKQLEAFKKTSHLIEDFHDKNFVFCRDNGYPFTQHNINDRMQRLLKMTSIKKNATPHIFRHTYISMLAEAEIDINTIMKRVGHDDMKTTLKIYTHVTDKMKKNAAEKIRNHFGSILDF